MSRMYSTGVSQLRILAVSDGCSYFRPRSRARSGQVHAVRNDDAARPMDEKKSFGSLSAWEPTRDEDFLSTKCMVCDLLFANSTTQEDKLKTRRAIIMPSTSYTHIFISTNDEVTRKPSNPWPFIPGTEGFENLMDLDTI